MNEPKKYEVQHFHKVWYDTGEVVSYPVVYLTSIIFASGWERYRFRELPNGPLWRVEAQREYHMSHGMIAGDKRVNDSYFIRPAHLVRIECVNAPQVIPAEPEAQLLAAYEWNAKLQHGVVDYDGFRDGSITVDSKITQEEFERRAMHATRMVVRKPVEPVPTPEPHRETEWRELALSLNTQISGYLQVGGLWNPEMMEHDKVRDMLMDFQKRVAEIRRPIAPAQREGTDGTPETDAQAASHFDMSFVDGQFVPADFARILELRALRAEDGCRKGHAARLQAGDMAAEIEELKAKLAARRPFSDQLAQQVIDSQAKSLREYEERLNGWFLQRDALQAERDALKTRLTKIGNACIVGITGAAEDGNETDPEILWKAINESVRLGHERNDEVNALRGQLHSLETDGAAMADTIQSLTASLAAAERERDEAIARMGITTKDPCVYCGKPCSSLAGNPALWPMYFPEPDGTGKCQAHHTGCVIERLQSLTAAKAELDEARQTGEAAVDAALIAQTSAYGSIHKLNEMTKERDAAKAELATCRDRAHSLFRQISMLAPNLEAARNLAHDGIKEMVSPTPPPSAQA